MCGISGIINKDFKPVSKYEIKRMNNLIIHRGPDDEGYFFEKNFAFGHRRLAILDLSELGHQPMRYKGINGEYIIIYNGEIYNYIELKNELLRNGYRFKSNTDTEVILASYDKWGERCVNKFNGMWAFAIYDRRKNIIFCSRDRFGIKPFYYAEIDNKFIFGSEIKQLLLFFKNRYVNKNILLDYLIYGLEEHTNETFFKGIYKLPPSSNLVYDLNKNIFKIGKYYDLKINNSLEELNEKEAINLIKENLYNSIKLRLRSDVKVGTCLSGGLDSSSIAAIAGRIYTLKSKQKFIAIHAKSVEKRTDESSFAIGVANCCNLDLRIVEPSLGEIKENINKVIYIQEEPFGSLSVIMQYLVMKKAKEIGLKVMLDGQGADEIFMGYERYLPIYLSNALFNFRFFEYISQIVKVSTYKVDKKRVFLNSLLYPFKDKIIKLKFKIRESKLIANGIEYSIDRIYKFFEPLDIKNFQKREIFYTSLPHLLKYEDRNSMINSIETRLPFVECKLAESALSVKDSYKIKNGYSKYILRKIVESLLPSNIVWRKNKFGFEAPSNLWIAKYKHEMLEAIRNSEILAIIFKLEKLDTISNKPIFWRLYNIAKWEEIYKVKI